MANEEFDVTEIYLKENESIDDVTDEPGVYEVHEFENPDEVTVMFVD